MLESHNRNLVSVSFLLPYPSSQQTKIIMGESPDELPGAKTNRIQKKKRGSKNSERRLVEYFAVVSSIPKKNVDGDQSVEMTASLATTRRDDGAGAVEEDQANIAAEEKLAEPTVQKKSTNPFDDDTAESSTNNDDGGGSDDEDDDDFHFVDDNDFQPVITARYPREDHKGNPLQESVTCFCHPGGTINLRLESCMPKVSQSMLIVLV